MTEPPPTPITSQPPTAALGESSSQAAESSTCSEATEEVGSRQSIQSQGGSQGSGQPTVAAAHWLGNILTAAFGSNTTPPTRVDAPWIVDSQDAELSVA